jgi:transposase
MKTVRKTYSREFKLEALQLLESCDKSAAQIARDLGIPEGSLYRWRNGFRARGDQAFPGQGNLPADEEELRKLVRENEVLRQERDILKKAIAIFTRTKQ